MPYLGIATSNPYIYFSRIKLRHAQYLSFCKSGISWFFQVGKYLQQAVEL